MGDATIHDAKRDFDEILRRTRNIKPKLRGTKKALGDIKKDAQDTLKQLEDISPSQTLQERMEDAGKINLDTDPPTLAEIRQLEERQNILEELQEKNTHIVATLDKIEQEEQDYKEQHQSNTTNKNLGKQVLLRGLMGAGHLFKTLGTAYFMATLNAGRPEAGAGAEAMMNRNTELVSSGLGQFSRFNLDLDIMPMDMMGGGMIPPPQMGGMMPMPFNPMGMMGQQERPYDPMRGILQTVAESLNSPPVSFGGFEPQNMLTSRKKEKDEILPSLKIGKTNIKFPHEEAKENFKKEYHQIFESLGNSLGEKKLPTKDTRYTAEQNLKKLLEEAIEYTNDEISSASKEKFIEQAKENIEKYMAKNLPEPLKPFYNIGIKTDEDYTHFIGNIDAPRINAYASALKAINDNNVDFPDIQYKSLKEAIENNVNDDAKSGIISGEVDEKLGSLLKKQDYELLDNLFSDNNKTNDVTAYANKLQECAKKTQTDGIKNPKQDEFVPIKIDNISDTKKTISFSAKATADWVNNLFPKRELDKGFAFYGQDIEPISDSTNKLKYNGAFAFAVADKEDANNHTLYSIKLDDNPLLSQDIYNFIGKFLNDENGKARNPKTEVKFSKADILKFKDICTGLNFSTEELDDTQSLLRKPMGTPEEGRKISDFIKEKAKEEAVKMNSWTRT